MKENKSSVKNYQNISNIKAMYEKINQLTEMNINIYEEMKGE